MKVSVYVVELFGENDLFCKGIDVFICIVFVIMKGFYFVLFVRMFCSWWYLTCDIEGAFLRV